MDADAQIDDAVAVQIIENEKPWPQVQGVPPELCGPIKWDHPCAARHTVVNGVLVPTQPKKSKVCIVGYAENSRHLAWYDDPDCEVWGVNQLYRFIPRADRWFQLHQNWNNPEYWAQGTDQAAWLQQAQCPIYMVEADPTIPMSLPYPKDWVKSELKCHEYFTSTIAFMLALAIAEGFQSIGMYGIDLIIGREYQFEKACVEFYFGIAHARVIEYHLPPNSALLWQSHTYGYETEPDYGFYSLSKLKARMDALHKEVTRCRDVAHISQGKLEAFEEMYTKTAEGTSSRAAMEEKLTDARKGVDQSLNQLYLHDGAYQEVQRMHAMLEVKTRGGNMGDK